MLKYAVIQPGDKFCGDGFGDLPLPIITLYHKYYYEQIAGYSLGHPLKFYDDLASAEKNSDWQEAIISFEEKNNQIKLLKIQFSQGAIRKNELQADGKAVEEIIRPQWQIRDITLNDFSNNALKEFDKQYKYFMLPSHPRYAIIKNEFNDSIKSSLFYLYDLTQYSSVIGYPIKLPIQFFENQNKAEAEFSTTDLLLEFESKGNKAQNILRCKPSQNEWSDDHRNGNLPHEFKKQFEEYLINIPHEVSKSPSVLK